MKRCGIAQRFRRDGARHVQKNLVAGAAVEGVARARRVPGEDLVDGDPLTFWATDDAVKTAEVEFTLPSDVKFNVVRLGEYIRLGQRIDGFELDRWIDGKWDTFARATSIGNCRLIRLADDITTNRVRLRVTEGSACPCLSDFGCSWRPAR